MPEPKTDAVLPEADPLLFVRQDWTEFRDAARISAKAGVGRDRLPRVLIKELVDNALDASGDVEFGEMEPDADDEAWYYVAGRGPGMPGTDADLAVHFSIRRALTSSKTRRIPSRGMLGNGLRVVVGIVLVDERVERAMGKLGPDLAATAVGLDRRLGAELEAAPTRHWSGVVRDAAERLSASGS